MKRYHCYCANLDDETERLFKKSKFLGQGNNGIVYSLPENKAIKLFYDIDVWSDESETLKKTNGSEYFPKLFKTDNLYIVREMVHGVQFDKYIKSNGINYSVTNAIYEVLQEFERLDFTKIDTRCKDLYLGYDGRIKIIDPKKCFKRKVNYPRHLMKGLLKNGVLNEFLFFMRQINSSKADEWEMKFKKYWKNEKNKKKYKGINYGYK